MGNSRAPYRASDAGSGTGRYSVFAELACGGMAMVYLGQLEGEHGFKRSVAIKRMHAQYARNTEFRGMFLDEARLVAKIRHPNVVPTLDIVSKEDSIFLVMEYVEGESASQLLVTGGAVAPRIAAAIASDALCGLHAAHELAGEGGKSLGVIHRDVSPANILVGVDGLARILDFGVAKAAGRTAPTRDGSIKGKVPYMPPEQLWGSELDRTVDVYAASVCLWEMLTGRRLFRGENDAETMKRVVEDDVPLPSSISPDAAPLDDVVMRGLSRDPSKRFQTALEMAKAISKAISPASRLEIGEWVSLVARLSLARRSALLRQMQEGELGPSPRDAAVVTEMIMAPVTSAAMTFSGQRPGTMKTKKRSFGQSFGAIGGAVVILAAVAFSFFREPLLHRIASHGTTSSVAAAAAPAPTTTVIQDATPPAPPPVAVSPATIELPSTPTPAPAASASKRLPKATRAWARPASRAAAAAAAGTTSETPAGAMPTPVPGAALGSRY